MVQEDTADVVPENMGDSALNTFEGSPDRYVALQYTQHRNPEYIRVTAINLHPNKAIHAYFYTLGESGGRHVPGARPGSTFQKCLQPTETTVIHFEEKRYNPQLFLFNAFFEEES